MKCLILITAYIVMLYCPPSPSLGPKTVFFWAPCVKWILVIAGIGDLKRPPEKMSVFQASALAVTGTIWARYSLVIIPVNYSLFLVNIFVGLTGFYQLSKIYNYRRGLAILEKKEIIYKPNTAQ